MKILFVRCSDEQLIQEFRVGAIFDPDTEIVNLTTRSSLPTRVTVAV